MKNSKKRPLVQPKKKYAIIVDGECEFWYFQMLKRHHKNLKVDLKPEIPQNKKLKDQFDMVNEYSKDYDKVIWIIDLDVISDETLKAKKSEKTAIQKLHDYCKKLEKNKNVLIIINNPCLEFWLLLHFKYSNKFFNTCYEVNRTLRKHLSDYEKTKKYYTTENQDIFLKLRHLLDQAIDNSRKLGKFSIENSQTGLSEMFLLFDIIDLKTEL